MSPIRKLLFVCVGVGALYGIQACTSETELNPQPLPPATGDGTRGPEGDESASDKNGQMAGGGTSPAPSTGTDGGAEGGDAAGAGDAR